MTTAFAEPIEGVNYHVELTQTDRGQVRTAHCHECGYTTSKWQRAKAIETFMTHWRVRHPDVAPLETCQRCYAAKVDVIREGACPIHGAVCKVCWAEEGHETCFVD